MTREVQEETKEEMEEEKEESERDYWALVDARDERGRTPLYMACAYEQTSAVGALLGECVCIFVFVCVLLSLVWLFYCWGRTEDKG